jgi:hypothetical protein
VLIAQAEKFEGQKASLADSIPTYDAWPKINAYALNE